MVQIPPDTVIGYNIEQDFVQAELSDGRVVQGKLVIGADGKNSFTELARSENSPC